ncbi:MAG: zinc transporter ZntB [Chitinispirillaceae bacterium]|nr:zinc transporter ZntB [Chitinispirillaceae bacterium]
MNEQVGFVFCKVIDGSGLSADVPLETCSTPLPEKGTFWIHLDFESEQSRNWLEEKSGLSAVTVEALLADDTRPRAASMDNGLLITLRGINCNPGADPDDMISIRLWMDDRRIISVRRLRVEAVNDMRKALDEGNGPESPGDFLVMLTDLMSERISGVVDDIDEGLDRIEEMIGEREPRKLRSELADFRRMIIRVRRYIIPQRETMVRLYMERIGWLSDSDTLRLREIAERTMRIIEDLDLMRDRASIAQEELNGRLSEQMNRTMYAMSIVATIFLPLGLLTGLLGINVGGIPGADTPWAFPAVCGILAVLAIVEYLLFRRKHII